MPEPRIKREQSLELPLSAIPSKHGGTIATLSAGPSSDCNRDEDANRPPPKPSPRPRSSKIAHDAHKRRPLAEIKRESAGPNHIPEPATDREITPRNDRLGVARHASGRPGAHAPPVAKSLSSRPISALATPKQTAILIKTRSNHHILSGNSLARLDRILGRRYALLTKTRYIARTARMDEFDFSGDNAIGMGGDMDNTALGAYAGVHGTYCINVCTICRLQ